MQYENAGDLLPEALLKELQKYAAGKLLYIPAGDEKKAWGATSGYRDRLKRRNRMICNKYAHGVTVSELADEYYLSLDSIKKIIYSKKKDKTLAYAPTVESAVQYAGAGLLEVWFQSYRLWSEPASADPQDTVADEAIIFGVVKLPLRLVQTEGMQVEWESDASPELTEAAKPPLLVRYEAGWFYAYGSPALLLALKQRKINTYPSLILLSGTADYKRFTREFGDVLFYVK